MRSFAASLLLMLTACSNPAPSPADKPAEGAPAAKAEAEVTPELAAQLEALGYGAKEGGVSAKAPATAAPYSGKVWTIGMSQTTLDEPWRVQMNQDIKNAAEKHPNLKVIFKDAQSDTLQQRNHIEEFVSQGVDLLIVSPKETALEMPIAAAYQAGIPVIVLDRAVPGDKFTMFIGANNRLIGEAAGNWIAQKLGGKGNVVELKGLMTSTPGQDRHSGFRAGIADTAIQVVFEADMQWKEPLARQEMESALARFDQIDCVYGHNDPAAHGAWLAAQAAGREDDMIFVGIDALPHEGLAYVEQGVLDACFEYPTGGADAIAYALQILEGKTVPRHVTSPSRIFTKENLAQGGERLDPRSGSEAAPSPEVTPAVTENEAAPAVEPAAAVQAP